MSKEDDIIRLTAAFFEDAVESIVKESFIKKLPNGEYRVLSEKGKNLGTYKSKEEANKRLRQVEFFKHKKASNDLTYSAAARALKKDKDLLLLFKKTYKEVFDQSLLKNDKNAEDNALSAAIDIVESKDKSIFKNAGAIPMGDANAAGKSIAELVKFIMQKISDDNRPKSIANLRRKITQLNENEIASKQLPNSSAIGHSLSLLKYMLFSHTPQYVRAVLDAVAAAL